MRSTTRTSWGGWNRWRSYGGDRPTSRGSRVSSSGPPCRAVPGVIDHDVGIHHGRCAVLRLAGHDTCPGSPRSVPVSITIPYRNSRLTLVAVGVPAGEAAAAILPVARPGRRSWPRRERRHRASRQVDQFAARHGVSLPRHRRWRDVRGRCRGAWPQASTDASQRVRDESPTPVGRDPLAPLPPTVDTPAVTSRDVAPTLVEARAHAVRTALDDVMSTPAVVIDEAVRIARSSSSVEDS